MKSARKANEASWLTPQEIKEAESLQVLFDAVNGRANSVSADSLITRRDLAHKTYLDNPSEENFLALKHAQIELVLFRADSTVKETCKAAVRSFVVAQVLPWAGSIIDRGLSIAQSTLAAVTKREEARNLQLTCQPLKKSDIIDAARAPIQQLRDIKASISSAGRHNSPNSLLTSFAAINFVAPPADDVG